jgi:hypothetical protein
MNNTLHVSNEYKLIMILLVVFIITFTNIGSFLFGKSCSNCSKCSGVVENYQNTKNSKISYNDFLTFLLVGTISGEKIYIENLLEKFGNKEHRYKKYLEKNSKQMSRVFKDKKYAYTFLENLVYTGILKEMPVSSNQTQ